MTILLSRRAMAASIALAPIAIASRAKAAAKTILTISGKISTSGGTSEWDRDELEKLGLVSIETTTPWHNGKVKFEGVPLRLLMKQVGASGQSIQALALNDYATEIPLADFEKYNVILALKRDGDYMPVRDKGPLFIVYPYDSDPDLKSQKYYARSAWQVKSLVVK